MIDALVARRKGKADFPSWVFLDDKLKIESLISWNKYKKFYNFWYETEYKTKEGGDDEKSDSDNSVKKDPSSSSSSSSSAGNGVEGKSPESTKSPKQDAAPVQSSTGPAPNAPFGGGQFNTAGKTSNNQFSNPNKNPFESYFAAQNAKSKKNKDGIDIDNDAEFEYDGEYFTTWKELVEYSEEMDDSKLYVIIALIEDYETDFPNIAQNIAKRQLKLAGKTPEEHRKMADVVLTTCHKAKGMEFDDPVLVWEDYEIPVQHVRKDADGNIIEDGKFDVPSTKEAILKNIFENGLPKRKWVESLNILYVAITRAKKELQLSERVWEYIRLLKKEGYGRDVDVGDGGGSDDGPNGSQEDDGMDQDSDDVNESPNGRVDPKVLKQLREDYESKWKKFVDDYNTFECTNAHHTCVDFPINAGTVPWPQGRGSNVFAYCEEDESADSDLASDEKKAMLYEIFRRYHPDKFYALFPKADKEDKELREKLTYWFNKAKDELDCLRGPKV